MKRQALCAALALAALLSLFACVQTPVYRSDVSADDLADAAVVALGQEVNYLSPPADFLSDFFTSPDYAEQVALRRADVGNNLNELGVFRVTEGNASGMETLLRRYLTDSYARNADWYDSYIPRETPKLRDAEVRVYGNYVVYAILDGEDRAAAFAAIEERLQQPK